LCHCSKQNLQQEPFSKKQNVLPTPRSLNITYPISTITTTKKSRKQVFHLPRQISAEPVTRTLNADQPTFAGQSGASQG
jgi:hypothetical protein